MDAAAAERARKGSVEGQAMVFLQGNCLGCHNSEKEKGGLQLQSREAAVKGGDSGAAIQPGKPEKSLLFQVLAPDADPHMPPKKQVSADDMALVRRWISKGAKWDEKALARSGSPRAVSLAPAPENYQPTLALALSPSASRLAVGRGSMLAIYDVSGTNLTLMREFPAHIDTVQAIAWHPNGTQLATGAFRETVLWDAAKGERIWTARSNLTDRVTALVFSRSGDKLYVAEGMAPAGASVRILQAESGVEERKWPAHTDTILALALDADEKRLATAGADNLVKIWDTQTSKQLTLLEGHTGAVTGIAFNSASNELASAALDHQLKIWDIGTRESVVDVLLQNASATTLVWTEEGKRIVAARDDGCISSWTDFKRHTGAQSSETANYRELLKSPEVLHALAVDAAGKRVFAAGESGVVHVTSFEGKWIGKLEAPALLAGGKGLAAGDEEASPSFVRDVLPVMARAGCMAGGCHAKPQGQNGFKLSVFSYDPAGDFREIVHEARGRRISPSAPEESLLLLKPTATVEHGGGKRFERGSDEYKLIAQWIRGGMIYQHTNEPALLAVRVQPAKAVYRANQSLQLKVEAQYKDGSSRDVTKLADFVSNEKEIATVSENGLVRAGKVSGESVIVARYMGFVDGSRVTIPAVKRAAAKTKAAWPGSNFIDRAAGAKFQELGLSPSELCTDAEFLRRSSLDTIGRLPTAKETETFLADTSQDKRARWVEHLLAHPAYADYWANKWADLLRPNPDRVGVKSVFVLDQWLREAFRKNMRYDEFAKAFLLVEGSNHRDGPAVVYRDRREPPELTTMFSQIFLGTRMECAKCHHHPTEKWTQEDFYQFAAYFGPVKQKGAGLSPPISAGFETFYFKPGETVKHPVTGAVMKPRALDAPGVEEAMDVDPREGLVAWTLDPKNPFFAKAAANRVWANFFGRGIVEPVDDFRVSNPPSNEPLLNALAEDFVANGYDLKQLMRTILNSRLYQLSSTPNESNLHDTRNFSRSYRRRLPAEALLDSINDVLGVTDTFNGCPPGTRAMQTWSYKVNSQFLDAFSRPNPSSDAPCERDTKTSVVQALHMMNSRALHSKLSNPQGRVKAWADSAKPPEEIVREAYLTALNRYPTEKELEVAKSIYKAPDAKRQGATEDLLWALLNSAEFVFNH